MATASASANFHDKAGPVVLDLVDEAKKYTPVPYVQIRHQKGVHATLHVEQQVSGHGLHLRDSTLPCGSRDPPRPIPIFERASSRCRHYAPR